ncbi:MAG TPA: hypothetical protein VFK54_04330 [Candidatus Limnocylindrales bacterium]|nr:hypothetical protein [Candidatus Limnocylindrales bacterium]
MRVCSILVVVLLAGCGAAAQPGWTSAPPAASTATAIAAPTAARAASPGGPRPSAGASSGAGGTDVAWSTHTSAQFGFSLALPPNWAYLHRASADWPSRTYPGGGAPYIDQWGIPGAQLPALDITAQAVGPDSTWGDFLDLMDQGNARIGCTVEASSAIEVDGRPGRIQRQDCPHYLSWEVLVDAGDRRFAIYWLGPRTSPEVQEALFRRILDSIHLSDS